VDGLARLNRKNVNGGKAGLIKDLLEKKTTGLGGVGSQGKLGAREGAKPLQKGLFHGKKKTTEKACSKLWKKNKDSNLGKSVSWRGAYINCID